MLEKYDSEDKLLLSISRTAIGDAFSELNQPEEAIEMYKEGISIYKNKLTTPIILTKCAKLYTIQKDYNNAIKCYKAIKTEYPDSEEAKTVDKYINSINQKKSE